MDLIAIGVAAANSGNGGGGSSVSVDTTLTQSGKAADAKVTGDKIKKIETDGVATINSVKVVGELDSVDDLNIAGKIFEVEGKDSTGEVFNDYENNIANGDYSHAEGHYTTASGNTSHAEGSGTRAEGDGSHAEGHRTKASSNYQHVQGKYNVEDADDKYAFIIGNGEDEDNRSNAIAIGWDGKIYVNNSETGIDLNTVVQDIADRYTKTETDNKITEKVSEIVADAPEDFNTLKEMSDWLNEHENSAAAMNSAIQENTAQISKVDAEIVVLESDVTDLKNQSSWRLIPTEFSTMADYVLTLPVGKHKLFFRNASDTHITDMPTNANMFLEVQKYSDTTIRVNAYPSRQIADTMYSRAYSGGTWGSWYKYTATVENQVTAE